MFKLGDNVWEPISREEKASGVSLGGTYLSDLNLFMARPYEFTVEPEFPETPVATCVVRRAIKEAVHFSYFYAPRGVRKGKEETKVFRAMMPSFTGWVFWDVVKCNAVGICGTEYVTKGGLGYEEVLKRFLLRMFGRSIREQQGEWT